MDRAAKKEMVTELNRVFKASNVVVVACDADTVRVQQHVINTGIRVQPPEQLEKLRVQRGFATGELENLDVALAINHALDAALEIGERDGVNFAGVTER